MPSARSGEQIASLPSGIDICFETFGDPDDPAMLLVMGLGGPMGWWDPELCDKLSAHGYFVIRYDNRDTGRSTKLTEHPVSRLDIIRTFLGKGAAPYGLSDLADDAFGLLDHLSIDAAHLVGVSMGGMIVQTMAIAQPDRALSMTSIMSTTGSRRVGWQHPRLIPALLASAGNSRESYIARSLRTGAVIGSPEFPADDEIARERAGETFDRGWSASGVARQMLAVLTQPDRTKDLAALDLPVTVIHGMRDRLVHRSGGRAVARAITGAEHIEIPGMAHDLPTQLHDTYVEAIVRTARRARQP